MGRLTPARMERRGIVPSRFLKESICRSEEIDSLTWFEEVLFYRLIVACDDYGRFDARPKIIKGQCFPLKDITGKDIDKALAKLSAVGLIIVYEVQGRPVLQMKTWEKHQTTRAQKSKYPSFDEACIQMYSDVSKCNDLSADEIKAGSSQKSLQQIIPEEPSVITLLLNTGEEYGIVQSDIAEWQELYPAVDIMQELRNMKGWCKENSTKRKTVRGIRRFITSWLAREQNRGGTVGYKKVSSSQGSYGNRLSELLNESRGDFNG